MGIPSSFFSMAPSNTQVAFALASNNKQAKAANIHVYFGLQTPINNSNKQTHNVDRASVHRHSSLRSATVGSGHLVR